MQKEPSSRMDWAERKDPPKCLPLHHAAEYMKLILQQLYKQGAR